MTEKRTHAIANRIRATSFLAIIGQACVDWAFDVGECHFCDYDVLGTAYDAERSPPKPHADDCPVGLYIAEHNLNSDKRRP